MDLEEKRIYLNQTFNAALGAGLCRTSKQFAELVGVDKSSVSSAMNGSERHLTDNFIEKVHRWAVQFGLEEDASVPVPPPVMPKTDGGVWIPHETLELYNNIAATCRNLSEILKRS